MLRKARHGWGRLLFFPSVCEKLLTLLSSLLRYGTAFAFFWGGTAITQNQNIERGAGTHTRMPVYAHTRQCQHWNLPLKSPSTTKLLLFCRSFYRTPSLRTVKIPEGATGREEALPPAPGAPRTAQGSRPRSRPQHCAAPSAIASRGRPAVKVRSMLASMTKYYQDRLEGKKSTH